jgi:hypothetical protein
MDNTTQTTFELFPNLPKELRLEIWRLARFEARDVHFQLIPILEPANASDGGVLITDLHHKALTPVSALLHTNQEARVEALRVYVTCFEEMSSAKGESKGCNYPINLHQSITRYHVCYITKAELFRWSL